MKAGSLASVEGEIQEVDSYFNEFEQQGDVLKESFEISQRLSNLTGDVIAYEGRAALQTLEDAEEVRINEDAISTVERPDIVTKYTEFLLVPDEFIVTASSSGSFVFPLLEEQLGVTIEDIEIHLDSYWHAKSEANPWKVGFYGRTANADNGVLHGADLLEDSDVGSALADSRKNQLGLEFSRDGRIFKIFVTESGYVEVYSPDDLTSSEFITFIQEELVEHLIISD